MRNLRLALFVVLVVGTGFATGLLNPPGSWYAALAKPWFNPPTGMVGTQIDANCFAALTRALGRIDETLAA
jgi:hypothetical protein